MDARSMVTQVIQEGGFDVDRDRALGWLNEKYLSALARSLWVKATVDVATTAPGVWEFDWPAAAVRVLSLDIAYTDGTKEHDEASLEQLRGLRSGRLRLRGRNGVVVQTFDGAGARKLAVFPAPERAGGAVTALAALKGTPLADDAASFPVLDDDQHPGLVDGAIGVGLARIDENLAEADRYETRYEAMVSEAERRAKASFDLGTNQLQVAGFHF